MTQTKNYIYLAGPWFNPRQLEILELTKNALDEVPIKYYSPKDEMLYEPGKDIDPMEVLATNVHAIRDAEVLVVITDGKDTGTMFEAGLAFALQKQIFYLWVDHKPGDKFNLMLGASGVVCMDYVELQTALEEHIIGCVYDTSIREDIDYE